MLHQTLLRKLSAAAFGLSLVTTPFAAGAATITVNPQPGTSGASGSDIQVTIDGTEFFNGTQGGALSVTWKTAVINLKGGLAGLNITFPGGPAMGLFFGPPQLDAATDPVFTTLTFDTTISDFITPAVAGPDFQIATLTFVAVAPGKTQTTLGLQAAVFPWREADGITEIDFTTGNLAGNALVGNEVTVDPTAVPEPMSLALVGGTVLGLVGLNRKRQTA